MQPALKSRPVTTVDTPTWAMYRNQVNQHFGGLPPLTRQTVELVAIHYLRIPPQFLGLAIAEVPIRKPDDDGKVELSLRFVSDGDRPFR